MIVCIPSIGKSPLLVDLLKVIVAEPYVQRILLVDNSADCNPNALHLALTGGIEISNALDGGRLTAYQNTGRTIYDAWNMAIAMGTALDLPVALLNDDIVLKPGSLAAAAKHIPKYGAVGLNYFEPNMPVNPQFTVREVFGTYRTGGIGGFAFIVAPGSPEVNGRFRWWYGDDDLLERIKHAGKRLCIALGAPVGHPAPSTSGNQMEWLAEAISQDTELYHSLWGLT